ncbi:MAG: hypothetical protein O7B25_03250 [Gammaproteobacteria bacterium]|nr:hypothetical protein [Gammaproteobacteria bacterium]
MISASAPGKVILWGEYAVLAGAPAMVMAVDRRAACNIDTLAPRTGDANVWRFTSQGFTAPEIELDVSDLTANSPPEHAGSLMFWHVARELLQSSDRSELPAGARVVTDSQGFYQDGEKLGIGSSAAVCVAVYAAGCELLGLRSDFKQALSIHNRFQDKPGSGIDVAAAYYGGSMRFQSQQAAPFDLAPYLQLRFIWTGHAAKTTHHIQRFNTWVELGDLAPLTALANTSDALFEHTDLATLGRYCNELKDLDAAAELGIYSGRHSQLDHLAIDAEVVYKPCGAGGGDIGVAISDE